jgi:putative transposase
VSDGPPSYKNRRCPVEIISRCVWLYFRFPLSYREVEELMLQRGVIVSYETIRRWCGKFGQAYASSLRRRHPQPGDKWHLDEVFIGINGEQKYLWRAVDADGHVLDILVQGRRDTAAARRFFRKLLKKTGAVPRVIVTDKLRSYGAAHREVMPSVEHRSHKGPEQPGGELPPANKTARTRDERLPALRRGTTVPVRVHRHFAPLPARTPPDDRRPPPLRDDPPLHPLEPHHRQHRHARHSLSNRPTNSLYLPSDHPTSNNVTAPGAVAINLVEKVPLVMLGQFVVE